MFTERMRLSTQRLSALRLEQSALSNVWWPVALRKNNEQHEKALVLAQQAVQIARQSSGEKHPVYAGSLNNLAQIYQDMGKLSALAGVREFPVRVKCASLAWHTLKAALNHEHRTSTE